MSDSTKLQAIRLLLEEKSKALETEMTNLQWHGVCGPPLAILDHQLKLAKEILEIINR